MDPRPKEARRIASRLHAAAKRLEEDANSRLTTLLLHQYFKLFICDFTPSMMKVTSVLRGLRLHFSDLQGVLLNCKAINSLMSPYWSEAQMLRRAKVQNVRMSADLSGLTLSQAKLSIDFAEFELVKHGERAPRLEKHLEERLLKEWYGKGVNQFGTSARIVDGSALQIDVLRIVVYPGSDGSSAVIEAKRVLSVSCDSSGREVGLQNCWLDVPADPPSRPTSGRVVRKQVSTERIIVDLVGVPTAATESKARGSLPASAKEAPTRARFLEESVIDLDVIILKNDKTGAWLDVELIFDSPRLQFLLGQLPFKISARGSPHKPFVESVTPPPLGDPATSSSISNASSRNIGTGQRKEKKSMRSRISKRIRKTFGKMKENSASEAPSTSGKATNESASADAEDEDARSAAALMSPRRFQGKFVCPECLESFGSGEELKKHFTDLHGSLWAESDDDDENDDGESLSLNGAERCRSSAPELGNALLKAPLEWAAGLEQQREAKLLRSTLLELEEIAVEQPLNALAVFAEGLGVLVEDLDETVMEGLDNLADNISQNNADVRIAPLVQRVAETDEKLSRLIADLDQAAYVTVQRGAENARVGRKSIEESVTKVNQAIDEATAAIGDAIGDGAAGLAQAVKTPSFLGWRAAAESSEKSKGHSGGEN